jgi:hypothetical protein
LFTGWNGFGCHRDERGSWFDQLASEELKTAPAWDSLKENFDTTCTADVCLDISGDHRPFFGFGSRNPDKAAEIFSTK